MEYTYEELNKTFFIDSGSQLRQDDPSALKEIIQLIQTVMAKTDPQRLTYAYLHLLL